MSNSRAAQEEDMGDDGGHGGFVFGGDPEFDWGPSKKSRRKGRLRAGLLVVVLLASAYAALNQGGSHQNSAIVCGKATVHAPAPVGDVATRYCGRPRGKLAVTSRTNPGRKLRNSCVARGDGILAPGTTYCFPEMERFKAVFAVVPANATKVDLTAVPQYFVQRIGTVDWIVALGTTSYLVRAPSGRAPLTVRTIRVWRWSGAAWVPSPAPKLQGVITVRNDFDVFFRQLN